LSCNVNVVVVGSPIFLESVGVAIQFEGLANGCDSILDASIEVQVGTYG